jgi:hypothetical protein
MAGFATESVLTEGSTIDGQIGNPISQVEGWGILLGEPEGDRYPEAEMTNSGKEILHNLL